MYPMFNWGDHIGLWNNNGLYRSDPSQSIIGWFEPNSSSATFNADTKEFSISCTDLMAFYTDTRGGHLSNWWESLTSPKYSFYDSIDSNNILHLLSFNLVFNIIKHLIITLASTYRHCNIPMFTIKIFMYFIN